MISYYTYLLLREDADPGEVERKFPAFVEKHLGEKMAKQVRCFLQPLTGIHLHSNMRGEISGNMDIRMIYLFTSIAVLILVIACINYMNLATARYALRTKEVGVRKVVGANRTQLIKQFLGESTIFTILAFLLAIMMVLSLLPWFNAFVGRNLSFNLLENQQFLLWMFALIVFVGIFSGTYPAVVISSVKSAAIFSNRFSVRENLWLRLTLRDQDGENHWRSKGFSYAILP